MHLQSPHILLYSCVSAEHVQTIVASVCPMVIVKLLSKIGLLFSCASLFLAMGPAFYRLSMFAGQHSRKPQISIFENK